MQLGRFLGLGLGGAIGVHWHMLNPPGFWALGLELSWKRAGFRTPRLQPKTPATAFWADRCDSSEAIPNSGIPWGSKSNNNAKSEVLLRTPFGRSHSRILGRQVSDRGRSTHGSSWKVQAGPSEECRSEWVWNLLKPQLQNAGEPPAPASRGEEFNV